MSEANTMTTQTQVRSTKEALKLALEAMESFQNGTNGLYEGEFQEEITAIKEALMSLQDGAQPAVAEQHKQRSVSEHLEPVAQCTNKDSWNCKYCRKIETCEAINDHRNFGKPKEPEQESVAMADYMAVVEKYVFLKASQRKPLSKTEIASLVTKNGGDDWWWKDIEQFARAIEAAHGIKE